MTNEKDPDNVFKEGDTVVCLTNGGWPIQVGKEYKVVRYTPRQWDSLMGCVSPAFVDIESGGKVHGFYAHRFKLKENEGLNYVANKIFKRNGN